LGERGGSSRKDPDAAIHFILKNKEVKIRCRGGPEKRKRVTYKGREERGGIE